MGENKRVFSVNHKGWIEVEDLQQAIGAQREPGLIYLPSGNWSESIIISQHNLTIIGEGKETIIEGQPGQPPITILAPHVRVVNLSVRTEHEVPAIAFTHGDAPQCVLENVTVLEGGSHGIFRDNKYGSAANAIINCEFHNLAGHGIYAPSGSGPKNLVKDNNANNIGGDFIHWGDDSSLILGNESDDAPIRLTNNSRWNFEKHAEGDVDVTDEGKNNVTASQFTEGD